MTVAQHVPPLKIEVVGLHVFGGMGANAGLLFAGRLERKGGGHGRVNLVFENEHIARGSREFLAPNALAGGGIVETEGDAQPVAIALHHPLQHQVDAQFARQPGERQISILGHRFLHRVRRCQVDFLQLKQLGRESFRNAIGHVAEGFLVPNLFQGQNGDVLSLLQ